MQNQELHFGKSYLIENYHGEPELQSYNQNEAEGRPNLDKLLMQFKETTESTQQAIANAEIQVGKLAEEMTQFVARREGWCCVVILKRRGKCPLVELFG